MAAKRDLETEVTALQIGRIALLDNIQALDYRVQTLEKCVLDLMALFDSQKKLNELTEKHMTATSALFSAQTELNNMFTEAILKGVM